jgi:hypothetical protein
MKTPAVPHPSPRMVPLTAVIQANSPLSNPFFSMAPAVSMFMQAQVRMFYN